MANLFGLNTASYPTLVQVLTWTNIGVFDHAAQKSGGNVTVTDALAKAQLKAIGSPAYLIET
jgi:hypothetical protein